MGCRDQRQRQRAGLRGGEEVRKVKECIYGEENGKTICEKSRNPEVREKRKRRNCQTEKMMASVQPVTKWQGDRSEMGRVSQLEKEG